MFLEEGIIVEQETDVCVRREEERGREGEDAASEQPLSSTAVLPFTTSRNSPGGALLMKLLTISTCEARGAGVRSLGEEAGQTFSLSETESSASLAMREGVRGRRQATVTQTDSQTSTA